jgi:3-dehydroquinate synthase
VEQDIEVRFHYPVVFLRGLFDPHQSALACEIERADPNRRHRVLMFVDDGFASAWPRVAEDMAQYAQAWSQVMELMAPPIFVPGGEQIKHDMDTIRDLLHRLSRSGLCRHSFVLVAGGGAVLDAVGFCASLVHRGLRIIRVPTTVLAQNDAGVGVKTGLDTDGGKNTIGTFAPPYAVFNDLNFLRTLDDANWIGGTAEAFKVAILKDAAFFEYLEHHAEAIPRRDEQVMETLVVRCAELHLDHIRTGGDPFEFGTARPLDFGHWAAHQLEAISGYKIGHGPAVAVGIAVDSLYARHEGWLSDRDCERVLRALCRAGFPLWYEELDRRLPNGQREILEGLRTFREHLGGDLCLTYPHGIGRRREERTIRTQQIEDCIQELRERFGPRAPHDG